MRTKKTNNEFISFARTFCEEFQKTGVTRSYGTIIKIQTKMFLQKFYFVLILLKTLQVFIKNINRLNVFLLICLTAQSPNNPI